MAKDAIARQSAMAIAPATLEAPLLDHPGDDGYNPHLSCSVLIDISIGYEVSPNPTVQEALVPLLPSGSGLNPETPIGPSFPPINGFFFGYIKGNISFAGRGC